MNNFISKEVTDLPIGDSGFYFTQRGLDNNTTINSIEHVSGSLYEVNLTLIKTTVDHDCCFESENCWDIITLDMFNKKAYPGYAEKINDNLFIIFDVNLGETNDSVVIKNILTNKTTKIDLFAKCFEVESDSGLFFLNGDIFDEENNAKEKWKVFFDINGNILYKGLCWNYQIEKNNLLVQERRLGGRSIQRLIS